MPGDPVKLFPVRLGIKLLELRHGLRSFHHAMCPPRTRTRQEPNYYYYYIRRHLTEIQVASNVVLCKCNLGQIHQVTRFERISVG